MKKTSSPPPIPRRDYDGIILDLLEDIIKAEIAAKTLIDRLDRISKRPGMKIVNIDGYVWTVATVAVISCFAGVLIGYLLCEKAPVWLSG